MVKRLLGSAQFGLEKQESESDPIFVHKHQHDPSEGSYKTLWWRLVLEFVIDGEVNINYWWYWFILVYNWSPPNYYVYFSISQRIIV